VRQASAAENRSPQRRTGSADEARPEDARERARKVKKVARDLLDLLKGEKLVLDWRKKEMTRAGVWQTIEIMLDYLPEVFDKPLYEKKCDAVYQHVYDAYYGQDRSVYGTVH
jgi:type I restriction enzyme R subunit